MHPSSNKGLIINAKLVEAVLQRLASQMVEILHFYPNLKIIAVQPRGVDLALDLCNRVSFLTGKFITPWKIDPTFYRDDIGARQRLLFPNETDMGWEIENQPIILIDDVIFTGRTVRAAMDAILDLGRPRWIKLLVLINRHLEREVPIAVDFEGMRIDLDANQKIKIEIKANSIETRIFIQENERI